MRKTLLQGALGAALAVTIEKRLKTVNYALLAEPFRLRNEKDGGWRCEFWGKIVRSAVSAAWVSGDPELRKIIDRTVREIMACQTPDGCISSYPEELQTGGWDIWGRKYVLLGLIRYYELLNPDPEVLDCCRRLADHLMTQVGPGIKPITACGWHDGLAASSILGAFAALWRLTGEKRYRQYADWIIGLGCSATGNIFQCVISGVTPAALGNGKAYEMTSCFQGLAELLLIEPDASGIAGVVKYFEEVLKREIYITGVGGAKDTVGEYWYDCALRQTRSDCGALGETCVTTTWIHYCADILRLTDDCRAADALEISLYNGILGAMAPDGSHWMHANPTPLTGGGFKSCAEDQIGKCFGTPFDGNDCCRAQGPEALAIAPGLAVLEDDRRLTVNFFEPLSSGSLVIEGGYPREPEAVISFTAPEEKMLRVRAPQFLEAVLVNGRSVPFARGAYLELGGGWKPGDRIALKFDFSLREIPAPGDPGRVAVMRGPLVLAADSRTEVPGAMVSVRWRSLTLCDYASAGGLFTPENTLTVWHDRQTVSPQG